MYDIRLDVEAISVNDCHTMIAQYNQLEKRSILGDCLLRTVAARQQLGDHMIVFAMMNVYVACLEKFYSLHYRKAVSSC